MFAAWEPVSVDRRTFAALALVATLALAACGPAADPLPPYPTAILRTPIKVEGPPCAIVEWVPLHDIRLMCFELLLDDVPRPEAAPAIGGIVAAPDGTLYVLYTAAGEIRALRDADGDLFPEAPETVADGLALPSAIALHDGALYVAGPGGVTRLDDVDGDGAFETQTALVDALPYDTGFWPGAIAVGPDERLYVTVGGDCLRCEAEDVRPGRLLSFALDGTDEREVATGFYRPGGLAWHPDTGDLWLVDGGGPSAPAELNRIVPGADYGFPGCTADAPDVPECAGTEPPAVLLPVQSSPAALAFYTADGFALWQGDLLVALGGSATLPEPSGYSVVAVDFADGMPTGAVDTVVPSSDEPVQFRSLAAVALGGRGFFPQHPAGVAVTPQGEIVVATQEGRVFRARPRTSSY